MTPRKMTLAECLDACGGYVTLADSFTKANSIINNPEYERITCSYSGGSDSDIMLDLLWRIDRDNKLKFVWFDTGMEFQATKDHLKEVEQKYGIEIERIRPKVNIIQSCRKNGIPFISKQVSESIEYGQKQGFDFTDKTSDEMKAEGMSGWLAVWWNNEHRFKIEGFRSMRNISYNKLLKEFLIHEAPPFKVSNKCCHTAKKDVAKECRRRFRTQVECVGIRQAEGGIRAMVYKNCFAESQGVMNYRPLFWYKDADKEAYEQIFEVTHSRCYTEYGLKRTGCAGCPYGYIRDHEEMEAIRQHEPKLYKACLNVFGPAYEYTERYLAFRHEIEAKERAEKKQAKLEEEGTQTIFDYMQKEADT